MFNSTGGPVRRPESGEGIILGKSSLPEAPSVEEKTGLFPTLHKADESAELFDWTDPDEEVLEAKTRNSTSEHQDDASRQSNGWSLSVDNKKADLAWLLASSAYMFGMLTVVLVLVFRVGIIFGWLGPLLPESQFLIMGVVLFTTLVCGFSALGLVLREDVARRGERFVKRVVKSSLSAMLFMNPLIFVLLFSVFVWPDLSPYF